MAEYSLSRAVDPFFETAINQIYLQKDKQIYLMDGPVALGKTSNFTLAGPYDAAKHVEPILRDGVQVRESVWAAIRESENSCTATIMETITDSMFPAEVIYKPGGPVKKVGSHPTHIIIQHSMSDGTLLHMDIECHGFNNEAAEDKLRSRSYVGCIIPEIQGIPWEIVEVARQRTGRWRPGQVRIVKTIDGVKHTLSGTQHLKMVFADGNIPARPHKMYDVLYDRPTLKGTSYLLLTPPAPIVPHPHDSFAQDKLAELMALYPSTKFEKQMVIWLPNPKCYYMTKHFETDALDPLTGETLYEDGKPVTVPWSGYSYWFSELSQTDSIVRRHVLGKPDNIGGGSAIYTTFDKKEHVKPINYIVGRKVYVGYDPGKWASFVFLQIQDDKKIGVFHEIIFERDDNVRTRAQFADFVVPWVTQNLRLSDVYFIPDPSAQFGTAHGESPIAIMRELSLNVELCKVANQDTAARKDSLGYFLDAERFLVDPSCSSVEMGLVGGYRYVSLKSGVVSTAVEKNKYSHTIEALQYPMVNIYNELVGKKTLRNTNLPKGIYNVKKRN